MSPAAVKPRGTMTLWLALALMTAAAVFAVLWPLGRRPQPEAAREADLAVYRDQLGEIARDQSSGLVAPAEAEAARIEVSRRLLAAADAAQSSVDTGGADWRRRATALAVLLLVPLGAVALYALLGSPGLPDEPLAARQQQPREQLPLENLIAQVEAHLAINPDDGRGWEVIAPVYLRLGRFDDAVRARQNALRLNGASAAREADYGEALVAAANGVVTANAKAAFDRAVALEPQNVKARYFLGFAAEQDGKRDQAAAVWRKLLETPSLDPRWAELLRRSLARIDPAAAQARGPSEEQIQAAENQPPEQRRQMILDMVDRLAARLQRDGGDIEGWQRLVRAYIVLGDPQRAGAAMADARQAVAGDPDKLRTLDAFAKRLGLGS